MVGFLRSPWLIARSVLIEAVRRREIYAIVLVTVLLIGAVMSIDFFNLKDLHKFYREVALRVMGIATALTVIVLASRQLPREFQNRTIYPLLAKPVGRMAFLAGKLLGVMMAGAFCLGLFMSVYLAGALYLGQPVPWVLFLQYVTLQLAGMLVVATLCFWLSMLMNLDAAITIGAIFYFTSSVISSVISNLYDFADEFGRMGMTAMNYAIPQLALFDLSEKTVHAGEMWPPLSAWSMLAVLAYGFVWSALYFSLALAWFRRRPL